MVLTFHWTVNNVLYLIIIFIFRLSSEDFLIISLNLCIIWTFHRKIYNKIINKRSKYNKD